MYVNKTLVSAHGVSKKFTRGLKRSLYYGVRDIASEVFGTSRRSQALRAGEFWALKNITFRLERGEALGLIGQNGSGKTTLLRLIGGLIKIDSGEILVRGRVAPLIALGAGFSPVLTGRENIYVNMAILGLDHDEIAAKFNDVVTFAELGEAIDGPVQTYSSGMAARLGFSCAIHTNPDVLLVDEVLSVGDFRFRAKCYRRIAEMRRGGTSLILVSHNSNAIMSMCDRVLYLSNGEAIMCDKPQQTIERFERDLSVNSGGAVGSIDLPEKSPSESTGIDIRRVYLRDGAGRVVQSLRTGDGASLFIKCRLRKAVARIGVALIIRQTNGEPGSVLNLHSERDGITFGLDLGEAELSCDMESLGLPPGVYTAKLSVTTGVNEIADAVETFNFEVTPGANVIDSLFYQPRKWNALLLNEESVKCGN